VNEERWRASARNAGALRRGGASPFYTGSLLFHDGVIAFAERGTARPAFEIALRVPCASRSGGT